MSWSNVKLILMREVRDQLRDRRTLFMIAVLPLVLYPLMGLSFFQVTQFVREHPIRVLLLGAPQDADLPPLVQGDHFDESLFHEPRSARLLQLTSGQSDVSGADAPLDPAARARREMQAGNYDVIVYFPPDFADRFERLRRSLVERKDEPPPSKAESSAASPAIPGVEIFPNLAKEASKAAHRRVVDVLDRWRERIVEQTLRDGGIPAAAAGPFSIVTHDLAEKTQLNAAMWSKILPLVLVLWALTGAFYPAIDLCAGEKERGTLETLLSSPAERLEIVWGKLLTIMLFSMATAVLNLASMAITGSFVLSKLPSLGPPPGLALVWLLVALVPVSALFSALCLALAAFARSTKEGQYYLMPLVLITMPLTILPMAPGVELNLGNSLIPISGGVLLLRAMLEGDYIAALPYLPIVVAVTLCCCLLAIRWATSQFNTESVLFRESERWDVSLWLKHLHRDREATPNVAEAMFCGVLILMIRFFMSFALPAPQDAHDFVVLTAVTQLVVVLTPAMLMTIMLTRSPAQTLMLRMPPLLAILAGGMLAVTLHPAANLVQTIVQRVYPLSEQVIEQLKPLQSAMTDNLGVMILAFGVLPAVCEELAFRGFILSGFRRLGHKWTAIVLSSIFFGSAHVFFQQSLSACLLGCVIGFVAIQTGSLLPGLLFHIVHNCLTLTVASSAANLGDAHPLGWLFRNPATDGPLYQWPVIGASVVVSAAILFWFHRLPYARTPEESLQEAIEQQTAHWQAG